MPEEKPEQVGQEKPATQVDPAMIAVAIQRLSAEQNLVGGVLAGLGAALVGAAAWAGITVLTNYQIGWMAVGIGFLVGIAVRAVGKGIEKILGIVGAVLSLVGCFLGNLLSICYFVSAAQGVGFFEVLSRLSPGVAFELLKATFNPIDVLFYGIALYEGYRLSFRRISERDIVQAVGGSATNIQST